MLIGTHNGQFHCDDAMAVAILRYFILSETSLIRTRDSELLNTCDIVVDVGGEYSKEKLRFDHHQVKSPADLARPNGVPYAAAGLTWLAYSTPGPISTMVDERLIQAIDAADTGTSLVSNDLPKFPGISGISLSQIVFNMNTTWQEPSSPEDEMVGFEEAVELCGRVLLRTITHCVSELDAVSIVNLAAKQLLHDDRVLVLPRFVPWTTAVQDHHPSVTLVVFPDRQGQWMVQCVPVQLGSFVQKQPLPGNWAGLRGEALAKVCGVADAVFCHPGRFICGAASLDGATEMALRAVQLADAAVEDTADCS